VSRSRQDITFRYPELQDIPGWINAKRAILDGEIVVQDKKGASRFQLLQQRIGVVEKADIAERAEQSPVVYCVFDLLYFDDHDLMPAALVDRKKLLQAILKRGRYLKFSTHTTRDGKKAFAAAVRRQLEGIVAKHKTSPYVERRSSRWLKIKTELRQEVVIGGYTQPKGSREHFGALAVGLYRGDQLHYVGSVGGGFNRKSLEQMYKRLQEFKTKRSPFAEGTQPNDRVQWVEPTLVGEVKFAEWTADHRMRQPIFMGLRDDKDPRQVRFEHEQETRRQVAQAEKADRATQKNGSATKRKTSRRAG
jgi:bifunctional non-homologous end joining protein LigD